MPGQGAGNTTDRRENPRFLERDFVREAEVSICGVSSSLKGFLENGFVSLWQGWSFSMKGNPAEKFVISLSSTTKAKQDKSRGQTLSSLWRTTSQEEDVFENIVLGRAKRWRNLGSEKSEQKGRGITELLVKITE